jgi:hypothetical protein
MLFFFELGLFLLVMATLALGEFVGRGAALALWGAATAASVGGYLLALRPLGRLAAGAAGAASHGLPDGPGRRAGGSGAEGSDADARGAADAATPRHGGAPEGVGGRGSAGSPPAAPDPAAALDAKWARTVRHYWGRTNLLLLLGAGVVGGWYWLGLPG